MKIHEISLTYPYRSDTDIAYNIYANCSWIDVRRVLLLGTLQLDGSARAVARKSPPGTAVVTGAPHWAAKPDGSDITEFVFGYTAHAIESILKRNNRVPLHLMADSQAAPGAIYYAVGHLSSLSRLSLTQPLGLNTHVFTGDAKSRARILNSRGTATMRQQIRHLHIDPAIIRNHIRIVWYLARNTRNGVAEAQYGAGLARSSIGDLKQIAGKLPIRIIVCEHDKIFPPDEVMHSLRESNISDVEIVIAEGLPHTLLASRSGRLLLESLNS